MTFIHIILPLMLSLITSAVPDSGSGRDMIDAGKNNYINTEYMNIVKEFLPEGSELTEKAGMEPIASVDLDRDGREEIFGVFRQQSIKNAIFLLVLKNINNSWEKLGEIKGDGYNPDILSFADVDGDGADDILFGVKIGSAYSKLNIYSLIGNQTKRIFSKTYSRLDIINPKGNTEKDGRAALAIWTKDTAEAYKIQVVRWNGVELTAAKDQYRSYYKKVVEYYSGKVKETPDAAYYWYYLADAQSKTGLKKEALESIAKGLSLNQDYPTKQQFDELKRSVM